ncbi:hypothetical protein RI367_007123 [Sorochytrium milnesiophthora]
MPVQSKTITLAERDLVKGLQTALKHQLPTDELLLSFVRLHPREHLAQLAVYCMRSERPVAVRIFKYLSRFLAYDFEAAVDKTQYIYTTAYACMRLCAARHAEIAAEANAYGVNDPSFYTAVNVRRPSVMVLEKVARLRGQMADAEESLFRGWQLLQVHTPADMPIAVSAMTGLHRQWTDLCDVYLLMMAKAYVLMGKYQDAVRSLTLTSIRSVMLDMEAHAIPGLIRAVSLLQLGHLGDAYTTLDKLRERQLALRELHELDTTAPVPAGDAKPRHIRSRLMPRDQLAQHASSAPSLPSPAASTAGISPTHSPKGMLSPLLPCQDRFRPMDPLLRGSNSGGSLHLLAGRKKKELVPLHPSTAVHLSHDLLLFIGLRVNLSEQEWNGLLSALNKFDERTYNRGRDAVTFRKYLTQKVDTVQLSLQFLRNWTPPTAALDELASPLSCRAS